jgi:hypothetical protein
MRLALLIEAERAAQTGRPERKPRPVKRQKRRRKVKAHADKG